MRLGLSVSCLNVALILVSCVKKTPEAKPLDATAALTTSLPEPPERSASPACRESRLLPEILNLRDFDPLPSTVLQRHDSRVVARSLVRRLQHQNDGAMSTPGNTVDMLKETKLIMAFPAARGDRDILSAIVSGGFLNQHQTQRSGGTFNPSFRAKAEDWMMAVTIESTYSSRPDAPAHTLRPKYSFVDLLPEDFLGDASTITNRFRDYGEISAVFLDEVKERATWSTGDSLGRSNPGMFERPDEARGYHAGFHSFLTHAPKELLRNEVMSYVEAQIWGELDLRDVHYFMVAPGTPGQVVQKLVATGLPVFEYEDRAMFDRTRRLPVRPLSPGQPARFDELGKSLREAWNKGFDTPCPH